MMLEERWGKADRGGGGARPSSSNEPDFMGFSSGESGRVALCSGDDGKEFCFCTVGGSRGLLKSD